jgi:RNA polymerase sigma factor (sigma-70 family)
MVPLDTGDLRSDDDPEQRLILREGAKNVVASVPEPEREILELRLEGLSLHEIEERTGVAFSTVNQRLERALRVVRKRARQGAVVRPAERQF